MTEDTNTFAYDAVCQVTTDGYAYDQRGRLTASPEGGFAWDDTSRLIETGDAVLTYNGLGDLRTRNEGDTTTHYYYNHAIALKPIVAERDATTGQFLRYYVWTPGGQLLYMIDAADGNKVYFYHFDRTGSTLALTDKDGAITDAYTYTPYGKLLGHTGSSRQPFTFVGQWGVRQEGTRGTFYHMRARYYDAVTARFISLEFLWPQITNPKQINPYQYALNEPIGHRDVSGLDVSPPDQKKDVGEVFAEHYRNYLSTLSLEQIKSEIQDIGSGLVTIYEPYRTPYGYDYGPSSSRQLQSLVDFLFFVSLNEQFLAEHIREMAHAYRLEHKLVLIEEELTARYSARYSAILEDILSGKRKIMDKPPLVPAAESEDSDPHRWEDYLDFVRRVSEDSDPLRSVRVWLVWLEWRKGPNRTAFSF